MNDTALRRISTAVVAVCAISLAVSLALVLSPGLRTWMGIGPAAQPPPYAQGQQVDVEPDAYSDAPVSLILFARSTCAACQRSADLYREVIASATRHGLAAVLVTPESDLDAERTFAESVGISATRVLHAAPGSIRLRAVPTLMIVDRTGSIRHVWFGAPDAPTHAAILAAVATPMGSRLP